MKRRARATLAMFFVFLGGMWGSRKAGATDFDITINEIHYNPLSGVEEDEFIELYNRGPTPVDLSGWAFVEGVHYVFPPGIVLEPKGYLLLSPDPDRTRAKYGLPAERVLGPYTGRLDNAGEVVALLNDEGEAIRRIHYLDGPPWPSRADGAGASLEFTDPFARQDFPWRWAASLFLDGTPLAANSTATTTAPAPEIVFIEEGDVWRYRKGTSPYPPEWWSVAFDDSSWLSGPTGIGYGDDDDATVLDDMEDGYISFAARRRFTVDAGDLARIGDLALIIDYDDAFVAYLNGVEVARANLGEPGTPVPYDAPADEGREAGDPELFFLPVSLLEPGPNVLAVEVHNASLGSSDASFNARLAGLPRPPSVASAAPGPVVINEVAPQEGGDPGFIEFYNLSDGDVDIGGYVLIDQNGARAVLPAPFVVAARGLKVIGEADLGFAPALGPRYALLKSDGRTLADSLNTRAPPAGPGAFSFGRYPDGDDDGVLVPSRTPGAPNAPPPSSTVVIHEIQYHPRYVPPSAECPRDCSDREQWIELFNFGADEVDLTGWSLTKAVEFEFPQGARIPAGGYLVVASSRQRFLELYPEVDPAIVLGDWRRDLAHDSDTINLRDRLGNLADHVRYGDGGPLNDEEPEDGVDDGTFRPSDWPPEADGTGRTLELIHPLLENRLGAAWAAGPDGGTPGAPNASFVANPLPVIGGVRHSPAVPLPGEGVTVTCRVSAVSALGRVEVQWRREGGGGQGTVVLRDDGLSGDRLPGDGIYGGTIPGQPDRTVVAFRIEARLGDGRTSLSPRPFPQAPYPGFEGPFYLYQTLAASPPANPSPTYYVVMAEADRLELETRPEESDVLLPATFIARGIGGRDEVHHLAGIRFRGSQVRSELPHSYRLEFRPEDPFLGVEVIHLNSQRIHREVLAADLFHRAGMPVAQTFTVNLFFQGDLDPQYIHKEHLDSEFLNRWFGGASDGGNLYRAIDPDDNATFPFQGDLSYLGPDPETYRPYYRKRTNREEDDYSDIIELCRTFDPVETPDSVFADRIEALIDTRQWARFFAAMACLTNQDGGIWNRTGEDYFLYHVPEDAPRPDAGKWLLLPWDVDETFRNAQERLFRPSIPAIRRFLTHQRFAPLYYCEVMKLRHGVFSRREMRRRFPLISFLFGFSTIDSIDSYLTARIGFFDENIPVALSAGSGMSNGLVFVSFGDTWRYFKGLSEPSGGTTAWTEVDFDDSSWLEGQAGFGYGDGDDRTLLADMEGNYSTVYIRRLFQVSDPDAVPGLELAVDYDDGFVAYLNGVEVARSELGAPGTFVPYFARADGGHEAGEPEVFDLSAFKGLLRAGDNVLAIQGANAALGSSDFSLDAELRTGAGSAGTFGCGDILFATGDVAFLTGRANACETWFVRVRGEAAPYDTFLARWEASVPLDPGENTITIEAFNALGERIETTDVSVVRLDGPLTPLGGRLTSNTVWDAAGGPYLLERNVTVPPGVTLTIRPGTVILAAEGASIIVNGRLAAAGTEGAPILFRATSCEGRWGGIALDGTGTRPNDPVHLLRACDLEFGDTPPGYAGHVAPVDAKVLIEGSRFRHLTANAVDGTDARVEVRNSLFEEIHEGVHCTRSTVIVVDSVFRRMIGDKDAIDFDGNGTERSLIEGCTFIGGSDDGIDLGRTSVDIRNNVFVDIQDKALSLEENGPLGPPSVTGNIMYDCGTAIALKNGVTILEGHHNTLVGNQEGLNLFAKAGADDGGHGFFHSMIIWQNIVDVALDARSSVEITYSDISQELWPGEGNISADPRFVNVAALDFSLREDSPCIGTGKDGTDMGAVPFEGARNPFIRGDVDEDGTLTITDPVRALDHLFRGGPGPACADRVDANDDGATDVSDPVYLLLYLFRGGPEPPPPFPDPGLDPTPDGLPCTG